MPGYVCVIEYVDVYAGISLKLYFIYLDVLVYVGIHWFISKMPHIKSSQNQVSLLSSSLGLFSQ